MDAEEPRDDSAVVRPPAARGPADHDDDDNDDGTAAPGNERPWVIGTLVTLVVATLGVVVGGAYIYRLADATPMANLIGRGAEIMIDAHDQPGAKSLRKVGCRQALVLNVDKLITLLDKLDQTPAKPRAELPDLLAVCRYEPEKVRDTAADMRCEALAKKLLARATPGPGRTFALVVNPLDENYAPGPAECALTFDAGGAAVGPYDPAWLPLPDPKEVDLAAIP
ncbi:MAG: hypothetical protein AAF928_04650 [Myxococcota bacterium]